MIATPTKIDNKTHSQLYNKESPILTVKHVASFRQYHAAYAGGHLYVWNVIFGLGVGVGGRGFGVVRLEHASVIKLETQLDDVIEIYIAGI